MRAYHLTDFVQMQIDNMGLENDEFMQIVQEELKELKAKAKLYDEIELNKVTKKFERTIHLIDEIGKEKFFGGDHLRGARLFQAHVDAALKELALFER